MRFEAHVDQESWNLAKALARFDFSDNDQMLRTVLADTIFSFGTNKRLFNSLLLLNRLKRWQRTLAALGRTAPLALSESDRQEYFDLACAATLSLLGDLERSPWLRPIPPERGPWPPPGRSAATCTCYGSTASSPKRTRSACCCR